MTTGPYVERVEHRSFALWQALHQQRHPVTCVWEMTARCNNDCRHCYINLPVGDREAKNTELSLDELETLAEEAKSLGVLNWLLTGGEPLLHGAFAEAYQLLRRKGFLVSLFTNACLVTAEHIELFRRMPPRSLEVTVYGITREVYERVSRCPGSYAAFRRGLDLLLEAGLKVRLKTVALRSNVHELSEIVSFCRQYGADLTRFDPLLHLRYDRNPQRNADIEAERLTPEEIVAAEQADEERATSLESCWQASEAHGDTACRHIFHCGAGQSSFTLGPAGDFRLCQSLCHPDCTVNVRGGGLAAAWQRFVPSVLAMESESQSFLDSCRHCALANLCLWCPAHGYLETGRLDDHTDYFCQVAQARARAIAARATASVAT